MVFPIIKADERGPLVVAAHVTFLTPGRHHQYAETKGKSVRRIFGPAQGGYIPFGPYNPDEPIIVTEG
jgi:hypothetical protein